MKRKDSHRNIYLPQRCIEILEQHRRRQNQQRENAGSRWQENDIIFASGIGTWLEPRKVNQWMTELCESAGLTQAGLHKLRHTAATIARSLGVDWKEIQAMLGHASAQITMDIYVDDIPELQRNAAELIDGGLIIATNKQPNSVATIEQPAKAPAKQAASQLPSKSPSGLKKQDRCPQKGRPPGGQHRL